MIRFTKNVDLNLDNSMRTHIDIHTLYILKHVL